MANYLTAEALDHVARAVVNNEGVLEAQTVENRNGTIVLMGGPAVKCKWAAALMPRHPMVATAASLRLQRRR